MATVQKLATTNYANARHTHDNMLLVIRELINQSGLSWWDVAVYSGVSYSTIRKWMTLKTKRPQALTIRYVLRALKKDLIIQDTETGQQTRISW